MQILHKAVVLQQIRLRERQRPAPLEVRQQIEHHQRILLQGTFVKTYRHAVDHKRGVTLGYRARGYRIVAVDLDKQVGRGYIVVHAAVDRRFELGRHGAQHGIVVGSFGRVYGLALGQKPHDAAVAHSRHARRIGRHEPYGILHVYRQTHAVDAVSLHEDAFIAVDQRIVLLGQTVGLGIRRRRLVAHIDVRHLVQKRLALSRGQHVARLLDHYIVVYIAVLAAGQREGHTGSIVGGQLHLVDIPLSGQIRRVHYAYVGTHAVDLLIEPEREGVVIAVVDYDRTLGCRVEIVPAYVARHGSSRTVVVVPVLDSQHRRHRHADRHRGHRHGHCRTLRGTTAAEEAAERIPHGQHAQTDPYREGIERTSVYVVALAHLVGRSVEVHHQSDTHHNEEPHHDDEVARIAVEMIYKSYQTQQKWQEEIGVARTVRSHFVGQVALWSAYKLVDGFDSRQPAAVQVNSVFILFELHVVLTSHEVPHEIPPEHIAHLVAQKEAYVFKARRLVAQRLAPGVLDLGRRHDQRRCRAASLILLDYILQLYPASLVALLAVGVPHAREPVHELGRIAVAEEYLARLVPARLGIEILRRLAVVVARGFARTVDHIHRRCRVIGAAQQRPVAVLVAVEHAQKAVRRIGIVAVHRRVGQRAYRYRGVGRKADENHRRSQQDRIQRAHAAAVGSPYRPAQSGEDGHDEEDYAAVYRQAERVDEELVDGCAHIYRIGDYHAVHGTEYGERDERRQSRFYQKLTSGRYAVTAEEVDEHQRRHGQQVKQVHADRKTHEIGYQDYPARGMRFVGLLLPFEH